MDYRFGVRLIVLAAIALLYPGCDTLSAQDEFEDAAFSAPSGFTHTDGEGRTVEEDSDDWRTAPAFGGVRVDPAYPNPYTEGFVTIVVSVGFADTIRGLLQLRAYDSSGRLVLLDDIREANSPGTYIFQFSPARLSRDGLVRLFVLDGRGEIVSYGDLMIQ